MGIYFLFFIICLVAQVVAIVRLKQTKQVKFWDACVGISLGSLVSALVAYWGFGERAMDLNDGLACLAILFVSVPLSLLMWGIGAIVRKTIKGKKIKLSRFCVAVGAVVVAANAVVIFAVPVIVEDAAQGGDAKVALDFVKVRYGEGNFRVVGNDCKEYSYNGITDRNLVGRYYEIATDYMAENFVVEVASNGHYVEADFFLPVYYSEKLGLEYKFSCEGDDGARWDFDEFDEYVLGEYGAEAELQIPAGTSVRGIYSDYAASWSTRDGVVYNANRYWVPEAGKVPSLDEVVEKMGED